jgi:Kef-type K+ transport system membrane component KefB/mannitol/fructose-specific phosphotransferase system IIA component (Ntr-type)
LTLPITDPVLIVAVAAGTFLLAPLLMERAGVPGLIGIIVAGAVVGPNGLGLLARDQTIVLLGTVGLLYLMFMAGAEIDLLGLRRYRNQSLVFGGLTFLLPQSLGTAVGVMLGYPLPAAILLASMFASHTLVSYPIALRFGITKNRAVTTAVGGTIVTDTLALLVLAVVAASTRGALDAAYWVRLAVFLSAFAAFVWLVLPRIGRWFFRRERTGGLAEYLFVFTALFGGAYLAGVAGAEAIVGAFLVGLALNRLMPEGSLLTNRVRFVGEAIFIPFFLLSVGMLMDVRVLLGDGRAWQVMIAMTATVTVTKWLAARAAAHVFGYSRAEGWTVFGLSVPQAAATLAATQIGLDVGLFDEAVLNGSVMMILVTCLAGPWVVARHGRGVALQEEQLPHDPGAAPQRILVPMANPATAEDLMDLALTLRAPDSAEPIHPLTVVPDDAARSDEFVATAERMLSHAVAYATGADVPVVPLTRVDHNFAHGIARGVAETRSSTIVIGWDGKRSHRRGVFGSVLDQLLDHTREQILVARLRHPLSTMRRLVLLVPQAADHAPGFPDAVRTLKLMANRLGATIAGHAVAAAAPPFQARFDAVRPDAPSTFVAVPSWSAVRETLGAELRPEDLVVVLSARRGSLAWHPALDRLPSTLAALDGASFIVMYPSEAVAAGTGAGRAFLPEALAASRVVLGLPALPYGEALGALLRTEFGADPARLAAVEEAVARSVAAFAPEVHPGVVVPHAAVPELRRTLVFLGVSREGIEFPGAARPARLVFLVLTPEERPQEHLDRLAEISRLVREPGMVRRLEEAEGVEDVMALDADDRDGSSVLSA